MLQYLLERPQNLRNAGMIGIGPMYSDYLDLQIYLKLLVKWSPIFGNVRIQVKISLRKKISVEIPALTPNKRNGGHMPIFEQPFYRHESPRLMP